jgi:hypothetical protein
MYIQTEIAMNVRIPTTALQPTIFRPSMLRIRMNGTRSIKQFKPWVTSPSKSVIGIRCVLKKVDF